VPDTTWVYFPCHLIADGAGLLCGVLKSLLARGSECPKVLVATHLHEIFRQDLLDPARVPIIFVHMQVMFTTDGGDLIDERKVVDDPVRPGESLTYLYK
jgi:DNA mismatch repair protein MSH5